VELARIELAKIDCRSIVIPFHHSPIVARAGLEPAVFSRRVRDLQSLEIAATLPSL
jgi:hypothetical protein